MRYVILCFCSLLAVLMGRNALCAASVSPNEEVQANFNQLMETNACPGCNLAGAVFNRLDLSEVNLEGANLANAKFFLADLAGANLKNANLQGAALGGADLADADLQGANLTGAILEGAYLEGAHMDGTITTRRPYVEQGGPDAGETVYIEDEANSKNLPFTDQAYVDKTEQPEQEAMTGTSSAGEQEIMVQDDLSQESQEASTIAAPEKEMVDAVHNEAVEQSKKLVMMSDVVVPEKMETQKMAGDEAVDAPKAESNEPDIETLLPESKEKAASMQDETPDTEAAAAPALAMTPPPEELVPEQKMADSDVERPMEENENSLNGAAAKSVEPAGEPEQEKTDESMAQMTEIGEETVVAQVTPPAAAMTASASEDGIEQQEPAEAPGQMNPSELQDETAATIEEEVMTAEDVRQPATEAAGPADDQEVKDVPAEPMMPAEEEVVMESGPDEGKARLVEKLLDDNRCVECDLSGVDLSGRNLDEADLERADLRHANLKGADLSEANLKGARLQGADLRNADLREADLYKADLSEADLTGARFEEALIDMVNFSGAVGAELEGARK